MVVKYIVYAFIKLHALINLGAGVDREIVVGSRSQRQKQGQSTCLKQTSVGYGLPLQYIFFLGPAAIFISINCSDVEISALHMIVGNY